MQTYDLEAGTKSPDLAEHKFITTATQLVFFSKSKPSLCLGYTHPDLFDPIPIEVLAFLLTVVRVHHSIHCLHQLTDGYVT